ncbi:hypothetical protein [Niveispirillum cyanobacteriorum]|uniref:hypothetical protein n=1 Tax=Niveispirillum cyanobacteriorum TaxID=1612173 RepID=UPI001319FFAD|nr:hypothetical protein [Niveispirillum cyanobacteriorum]GGE79566.1 hypothetical protein GCM10011317_40910 [Niveispirillum cyanobacteriorum]
MRERPLTRLLAATLVVMAAPVSLTLPASAAGQDDVLKCLGIVDNGARLACYDRTVPALRHTPQPPAAPSAPVPPAAPAVAAPVNKEQAFGAERIDRKDAPAGTVAQEAESITAKLTSVSQQTTDRYTFTLDNGQVWSQVVARSIANAKPGKLVKIEKGMFGSFTMTIDGVTGIIKVRRVK